jgi:hypothetical protein
MTLPHCMIVYKENPALSAEDIERHLRDNWPGLAQPGAVTYEDGQLSVVWDEDGDFVSSTLIDAPVPTPDLDYFCERSRFWTDAHSLLHGHDAHILMVSKSSRNAIEAMRLLTRVTAAVAATSSPLGVLWGSARHALPAALFGDFTPDMLRDDTLLCHLWVNFQAGWTGNTASNGCTTGLNALDLMDLEAKDVPEDPTALKARLHNIALYLLKNGLIIQDGDSLGSDENERIRAVYTDSVFGAEEKVIQLRYERPAPAAKRRRQPLH